MTDEWKIIADSNEEMLRYFKQLHADHLEKIQALKEGLFEVKIRLDELEKTRKVYSLNIDYRKSVFSPLPDENAVNEKEAELRTEMQDLLDRREDMENRLAEESYILKSLETRLKKLDSAKQEIRNKIQEEENALEEKEASDAFEFIREDDEPDLEEILQEHGKQILLLHSFDQTYLSTILDKRLRTEMDTLSYRMKQAEDFMRVDPVRAAMLIKEARQGTDRIYQIIEGQLKKYMTPIRESAGIADNLEDYILSLKDKHPEVVIDTEIGDLPFALSSVQLRMTIRLLRIFMENIFRHAEASRVSLKVSETNEDFIVELSDNGKGIPLDYKTNSPWYSGIHRAEEVLFLMGGSLEIHNSYPQGTYVRYSFPIDG